MRQQKQFSKSLAANKKALKAKAIYIGETTGLFKRFRIYDIKYFSITAPVIIFNELHKEIAQFGFAAKPRNRSIFRNKNYLTKMSINQFNKKFKKI